MKVKIFSLAMKLKRCHKGQNNQLVTLGGVKIQVVDKIMEIPNIYRLKTYNVLQVVDKIIEIPNIYKE